MYLDTVVIAGIITVLACIVFIGGFVAFIVKDAKKTNRK